MISNGFESLRFKANEIAGVINIDKTFKNKHLRKIKRNQFNYENSDEINDDTEHHFQIFYVIVIVITDRTVSLIIERFNRFQINNNDFSFLYNIGKLRKITNNDLIKNCLDLQNYLRDGDLYDI